MAKIQQKIIDIINKKRTNLIFSADLENGNDILKIIDLIGDKILGIKLHSDIVNDFNEDFIHKLKKNSELYNFIIIEDRKFCDIGNTVEKQSKKIVKYSDLVTCHGISGQGVIDGLKNNCLKYGCGILLVAQMSPIDNLIDEYYTSKIVSMANDNPDVVVGFISQQYLSPKHLHFTPGVNIVKTKDHNTPQNLINTNNIDVLIVGRGLINNLDKIYEFILLNEKNLKKWNKVFYPLDYIKKEITKCNIIKYGDFILNSGKKSNIYFDFKNIITYPKLLNKLCIQFSRIITNKDSVVLAGVPMGGISIASVLSQITGLPMILVRDNRKAHGTQNLIEGTYENKECIIVEDVISTGTSVINFIKKIPNIKINMILCILDRQLGGVEILRKMGYEVNSLFTYDDFNSRE